MIKVLIVDDSAFMRVKIRKAVESDPLIRVAGTARCGADAIKRAVDLSPDVITMDVQMPDMSGLEAVERIMELSPVPIIMISSLTSHGADITLRALEMGAVDYIPKDEITDDLLISKIHMAKSAVLNPSCNAQAPASNPVQRFSVIGIGISTGGPKALAQFIPKISGDITASIVIAQHLPPHFTQSLADRLDSMSEIRVKEAEDQEPLLPGWAYICPGGYHALINEKKRIVLASKAEYSQYHYTPSVDLLMGSIGRVYGREGLCIIMTGMGNDGAKGIGIAREHGSCIIAQSEESSTIYGMPKAVIDNKLHHRIVDLQHMHTVINDLCRPAPISQS